MDLPHSLIILIDILSQPCALLESKFFIIRKISSPFTLKEFNRDLVLYLSVGSALEWPAND